MWSFVEFHKRWIYFSNNSRLKSKEKALQIDIARWPAFIVTRHFIYIVTNFMCEWENLRYAHELVTRYLHIVRVGDVGHIVCPLFKENPKFIKFLLF